MYFSIVKVQNSTAKHFNPVHRIGFPAGNKRSTPVEHPEIFSATLGLSDPWQITHVTLSREEKRLDITVDYAHDGTFPCPRCGKKVKTCKVENETWFHDNFFRFATYLHARVPYIECCCGLCPVERPWSRAGSKFSLIS